MALKRIQDGNNVTNPNAGRKGVLVCNIIQKLLWRY